MLGFFDIQRNPRAFVRVVNNSDLVECVLQMHQRNKSKMEFKFLAIYKKKLNSFNFLKQFSKVHTFPVTSTRVRQKVGHSKEVKRLRVKQTKQIFKNSR